MKKSKNQKFTITMVTMIQPDDTIWLNANRTYSIGFRDVAETIQECFEEFNQSEELNFIVRLGFDRSMELVLSRSESVEGYLGQLIDQIQL